MQGYIKKICGSQVETHQTFNNNHQELQKNIAKKLCIPSLKTHQAFNNDHLNT
jgi:hypothetical protein